MIQPREFVFGKIMLIDLFRRNRLHNPSDGEEDRNETAEKR
jgi:hypothetical protein